MSVFPTLAGLVILLLATAPWLNVAFGQDATTREFNVNTPLDTSDHKKGDGYCADKDGNCSLRAALEESNALPGFPRLIINLPAGTYKLTLGQLVIQNSLSIRGAGADSTFVETTAVITFEQREFTDDESGQRIKRISGVKCKGGCFRILRISPKEGSQTGPFVRISGVTIRNGFNIGSGIGGGGGGLSISLKEAL